jgi:hypothetical protein
VYLIDEFRLGNFKAFGPTQVLPIKPITLIYGPNSGGKSSLIHGLLYVQEAHRPRAFLESSRLDSSRTELGGSIVDLGGFGQFVYRRDLSKRVTIGFHMTSGALSGDDLPAVVGPVTLEVELGSGPQQMAYRISCEGDALITFGARGRYLRLDQLNLAHPAMAEFAEYLRDRLAPRCQQSGLSCDDVLADAIREPYVRDEKQDVPPGYYAYGKGLFPSGVVCGDPCITDETGRPLMDPVGNDPDEPAVAIRDALHSFVNGLSWEIINEMSTLGYVGPFRSYPPRRITDITEATEGAGLGDMSPWYELIGDDDTRTAVNEWLGARFLSTPFEFRVRRYFDGDELRRETPGVGPALDSFSPAVSELVLVDKRTNTLVSHRDVGVGISQVLPILVWAVTRNCADTVAVEQPELHLHPALQAKLGDVFIEAALGRSRIAFLIETHSEHLLLRIMRRLRQTARGTLPKGLPKITPDQVAVVYIEPADGGSRIRTLELDEEGRLLDPWPGGFFEEGFKERFDVE